MATLGKKGEMIAVEFLASRGYQILERNYRVKIGEIDVVARDQNSLCFIEVKTRSSDAYGSPFESISYHKKKKLSLVAQCYLAQSSLFSCPVRFDVVAVWIDKKRHSTSIKLLKNAFDFVG